LNKPYKPLFYINLINGQTVYPQSRQQGLWATVTQESELQQESARKSPGENLIRNAKALQGKAFRRWQTFYPQKRQQTLCKTFSAAPLPPSTA
jgi:acyl-CoA reductase-like NAD-dependent aldehyde dehydrogenase